MDFLDPTKERLNRIALFVSYALVALAIGIASIVLLYTTDGYCVDGKGAVDRCGLVFVSSQPTGSNVYIDGKLKKDRTNTKFNLQSGSYAIKVTKDGYRDWQRTVSVVGGDVQRFDYPLLIPQNLQTSVLTTLNGTADLATQSPDHRWMLVADSGKLDTFKSYDVKNPEKPVTQTLTLPSGVLSASEAAAGLKLVEWSTDNKRVLLLHTYVANGAAAQEYIMVDRQDVENSVNVTKQLKLIATDQLTLFDKKFDKYYVYNTAAKTLRTAALEGDAPTANQVQAVLAYKSYSDDTLIYVTDTPPSGKKTDGFVSVVLQQGGRTLVLRKLPADGAKYLLDIARYAGDWFVVIGSNTQKGVYIYENPFDQKLVKSTDVPRPIRFLKVAQPTYVAFSANTQFIMAESGQHFAVYDVEYDSSYNYTTTTPLDNPQEHAVWMDGDRLTYVSGGKVYLADYDNINQHTLQTALPGYSVFYSPDYNYMFNLRTNDSSKTELVSTPLVIPKN